MFVIWSIWISPKWTKTAKNVSLKIKTKGIETNSIFCTTFFKYFYLIDFECPLRVKLHRNKMHLYAKFGSSDYMIHSMGSLFGYNYNVIDSISIRMVSIWKCSSRVWFGHSMSFTYKNEYRPEIGWQCMDFNHLKYAYLLQTIESVLSETIPFTYWIHECLKMCFFCFSSIGCWTRPIR